MLKIKIKSFFFDRRRVMDALDRKTRRSLARAGGFIRQVARRSIRKRKAASAAGSPPSSHTGLLRNFIYFGFDTIKNRVVVGPVALNQVDLARRDGTTIAVQGAAPQVLEHGGRVGFLEVKSKHSEWYRFDRRRTLRPGQTTRVRWAQYAARPYMGPALTKSLPRIAPMWGNSVTADA